MADRRRSNINGALLTITVCCAFLTGTMLTPLRMHAVGYGNGSYGEGNYNEGALDATTTVLISSDTSVNVGESITLTATITPSSATGTVTFKNGSTTIGTAVLSNGSGSITTSSIGAGSHSLTAVYGGNANYDTSTSSMVTQTVIAPDLSSSTTLILSGGGRRGISAAIDAAYAERFSRTDTVTSGREPTLLPQKDGNLSVEIQNKTVVFHDVPAHAWFAGYVAELLKSGIASGYKDTAENPLGLFGPANAVTYAEIAKMALEAAGEAMDSVATPYNTLAQNHWSASYIATAEQLGLSVYIVNLNIDAPATRGAVIQTLLEAFSIPLQQDATQPYKDLRPSHPHATAILTATKLGIISGDTDANGNTVGTVRPNDPINRAEVAKILSEMMAK